VSTLQAFAAADRLAPVPETREEATAEVWLRHYAAQAMAAHAEFRSALPSIDSPPASRPELGYLVTIAVASTVAAVALSTPPATAASLIWDLTPEAGALNGEYVDWLADLLDHLGINPADIDHHFEAADFNSVSRPAVGVAASSRATASWHAWATS
jgi:hypothetical protein